MSGHMPIRVTVTGSEAADVMTRRESDQRFASAHRSQIPTLPSTSFVLSFWGQASFEDSRRALAKEAADPEPSSMAGAQDSFYSWLNIRRNWIFNVEAASST